MKLRSAKGKLKIEHRIITGVRDFLEQLIEQESEIRSIIPGVIRRVRKARGPIKAHVTTPTTNGWKAIALSKGECQELFISTTLDKTELETAIRKALES